MKRHLSVLACLVMLIAIVFTVASCKPAEEPAHEHSYVSVETKAPTCSEKGVVNYTCSCGDTYDEEIAKKAHVEVAIPAVAATCEADGLTEGAKCSVCDAVTKAQVGVAKLGHNPGADATCTTAQVCTNEGCTKVFVAALGHDMAAATCEAPKSCKNCDYIEGEALGHSYSDENKAPTATSLGCVVSTCANCGDSYETPWTAEQYMASFAGTYGNVVKGYSLWFFSKTIYEVDENGEPISEAKKYVVNFYDNACVIDYYYDYTVSANVVDGALVVTISTTLWDNPDTGADDVAPEFVLGDIIATVDANGEWVLSSDLELENGEVGGGDEPGEGGDDNENEIVPIEGVAFSGEGAFGGMELTVIIGASQIQFISYSPYNGESAMIFDYTISDDGAYVLTVDGEAVNPYMASITVYDDGTAYAWYNGYDYDLASEGSEGGEGDDPVVPSNPELVLGENSVSITDTFNGAQVEFTATVAGTYYFVPGSNCVFCYDYSNYFEGDVVAIEFVAGQTIVFDVYAENRQPVSVVVTVSDTEPDEGGDEPGEGGNEGGNTGSGDYNTTIVEGANTLYFSAEEVAANSADRKVIITAAGEYKFAAGSLFIQYLVDADGNQIGKNASYYFELPAGEYTAHFAMLSMFGVAADTAQELNVTFIAELAGGDVVEPEEPECQHTNCYETMYHEAAVWGTCTTPGVVVYQCSDCDYYYTEATGTDSNNHNFFGGSKEVITQANCLTETNGLVRYTCANGCGETYDSEIDYTEAHDWNIITNNAATCTVDGAYHAVCTICEEVDEYTIYAEGHWPVEYGVTCGDTTTCAECDETYVVEHNFGMWGQATCTQAAFCYNCYSYVGEPLGHDWVEATCTEDSYCDRCGAAGEAASGHVLGDVEGKAATCTVDGYTAYKDCENCDYTEGKEVITAPGHADANGDFKCDSCSTVMLPADGEALTVAQAIAIGNLFTKDNYTTEKYYITGIITSVPDATWGNFYLTDANGDEILIYGLYSADGSVRYDAMTSKPVKGDEITVYTVLGFYTAAQGKNAWMDEFVAHDHAWVDATCKAPKTCSLCDATEGEAADHVYVDGACTSCGKEQGSTAVTNAKLDFSTKDNRTTYTTSQQIWEANGVKLTNDKSSSTSNVGDYTNPARFYKSSKITIEASGIKVIQFTCNSASYATSLKNSLGTNAAYTVSVSSSVVTVTFTEAVDSFVINLTDGQVRMNSLVVNP